MHRSSPPEADQPAARAFARVGWPNLVERLSRYATGTLRLARIGAGRAGVVEAADLVNALVEKSLDGTLGWTLPEHATDEEIVGLACAKLSGMQWTLRRQAARTVRHDAIEERADPSHDALARLMAKRRVTDLGRTFAGDADASAYLPRFLEGKTRAEIARELGWDVERARNVRLRIVRRVEALCAATEGEAEAGPNPGGRRHPLVAPTLTAPACSRELPAPSPAIRATAPGTELAHGPVHDEHGAVERRGAAPPRNGALP